MKNVKKKSLIGIIIALIIVVSFGLPSYAFDEINNLINRIMYYEDYGSYELDGIPDYSKYDYVILNENVPEFTEKEKNTKSYEFYSELDYLGRCGEVSANISTDLMPTEERGTIGQIKPSGWHTIKYDIIDGKYLYNRCHLIGYQLTGENANEKNLITCTRQMNTGAMLDIENDIAEYIKETNNHVLYRVTPVYEAENLLAKG